ncbi:uncharacterized protein LOC133840078 [Drosophila sulfurigaster albostrigata]|uniref:uncharacterized protein LOC133840078 n=1 Tax=Drosophila sulfurigaster albostrigata TaxID=89887 RepID=UPI002D2187A1|nr:uncharacterized protein LOC133840078 [Drosophila sulfurigaster albostrigata]
MQCKFIDICHFNNRFLPYKYIHITFVDVKPPPELLMEVTIDLTKPKAAHCGKNAAAFETERLLIQLVSEQPALYNSRHVRFKDDGYKKLLWQLIAIKVGKESSNCMSLWAELRHRYQQQVQRRRRRHRVGKRYASLLHEEQLLFLYPHVARMPLQRQTPEDQQTSNVSNADDDDDDDEVTIVEPQPAIIIDVDKVAIENYKLNGEQLHLIDHSISSNCSSTTSFVLPRIEADISVLPLATSEAVAVAPPRTSIISVVPNSKLSPGSDIASNNYSYSSGDSNASSGNNLNSSDSDKIYEAGIVTYLSKKSLKSLTVRNDKVPMPSIRSISNNPVKITDTNHNSKSNTNLVATSSSASASNSTPAAQLLRVEFRDCPSNGRMLHVTVNDVPIQANFNMSRTALFIREVMAVPQLHSKEPHLTNNINNLWSQLSKKFHLPDDICRGIWTFLSHNFNLFPQIAPMEDLMRPFKSTLKVWKKSHSFFSKFDEIARKHEWMLHKHELPALMQHCKRYEHLYWELRRPRPGESANSMRPPRMFTEQERLDVWREAKENFPQMDHQDVWSMFKYAFKTYMEDLEKGIDNSWPQNWWHVLKQLKFLINVRYHPHDPYYYIVHNKFMEEVKRCSIHDDDDVADGRRSAARHKMPPLASIEQTVVELAQFIGNDDRQLPSVNGFLLTESMRRHRRAFSVANTAEKRAAWIRISRELKSSVTECRLSFQHMLRQQRVWRISDPKGRCTLSTKYYCKR